MPRRQPTPGQARASARKRERQEEKAAALAARAAKAGISTEEMRQKDFAVVEALRVEGRKNGGRFTLSASPDAFLYRPGRTRNRYGVYV